MSTELFEHQRRTDANPDDKEALLKRNISSGRTWSTLHLVLMCFFVAIVAIAASNMDRIVDSLSNDDSTSPDSPARKEFGHDMYEYFEFKQENVLNFNWGSFGGYPSSIVDQISNLQKEIQQDINFWQTQVRTFSQMDTLQAFAHYMGVLCAYRFHKTTIKIKTTHQAFPIGWTSCSSTTPLRA